MDMLPLAQHLVQEIDQQLLVELRAKKLLKAEVREGIDVFFFWKHDLRWYNLDKKLPNQCTLNRIESKERHSTKCYSYGIYVIAYNSAERTEIQ